MTNEQLLIGAVTAMAAAIGHLYRRTWKLHDECLKDKAELWQYVKELEGLLSFSGKEPLTESGMKRRRAVRFRHPLARRASSNKDDDEE
jgi:hypothetical protein